MSGESTEETLLPERNASNFAAWFSGLLAHAPSAYVTIESYLKQILPDLRDIKNPEITREARSLTVHFLENQLDFEVPFDDLSDGEKCFFLCATVLAANRAYGPLCCFWDEPDNYIGISEVSHFAMALRSQFQRGGQFIATSHNSELIRTFSAENTILLDRKNHLEPTLARRISEMPIDGDLITALQLGDLRL